MRPHADCRAPHLEDSLERLRTRVDEMISEERAVMERAILREIRRVKASGGRLRGPWPQVLNALAHAAFLLGGFIAGWYCRG